MRTAARKFNCAHFYLIIDVLDHENYLNEYSAFMIKFFTLFTGLAHLTACAFYRLAGTVGSPSTYHVVQDQHTDRY